VGARDPRPGDIGRISGGATDLQPPCRDQRQEGRAGGLDPARAGHRRAVCRVCDQGRAASQRRQAADGFPDRQGRPGDLSRHRLSAGRSRRAADRAQAHSGNRQVPCPLLHARGDRGRHAALDEDLSRAVPLSEPILQSAPGQSGALRPARRGLVDGQTALVAALLAVLLAVLVLPPLYLLLQGAVTDAAGALTTRNFATALGGRLFLDSLVNTVLFAAGSAALALVVGTVTAWIVERTNTPLKGLAYLTTVISLGTPYVLYVGAWLLLLGKAGPINQLWREWTGGFDPLFNVYSLPGMILVEGLLWSPLVFLLIGASLRSFNPELEEAARMSGAGLWRTIRRITMGLSLPAMLALAMLVFIRAFEAFEVPALVGMPGRVYVLTTDIYQTMRSMPPDFGSASAFSVIMLAIVLVLLLFYGRLSRHAERFATVTGKGFRAKRLDIGWLRWPAAAILLVNFLVLLAVPIAMLVWASLLTFYQPLSRRALGLLTIANYRTVFAAEFLP